MNQMTLLFLGNLNNYKHPSLKFNNNKISKCPQQKHLVVVLDSELYLNIYNEQKKKTCNRIMGLMRGITVCLPRNALLKFINPLSDLIILTTLVFCMINARTNIF